MADEEQDSRTEAPTPRRLERAFEEGQIAFSSDFVAGLLLLAGVLFFMVYGRQFLEQLKGVLRYRLSYFQTAIDSPEALPGILLESVLGLVAIVLGLMGPLCAVSVLGSGLQTRFNISFKTIEMNWEKLDPVKGFQRIFSLRAVVRGVSAILKTLFVAVVTYYVIRARIPETLLSGFMPLETAFSQATSLFLAVAISISAALMLIGVADLGWEKWKHLQDLRMSKQDIKEEAKQDEGDPLVKARMRRLASELTRQTIAKEVPQSTVVITNPTHFAVALKFDRDSMQAPTVVAKGADLMAKRIIQIAKENGVAVVERKAVARFLYFNVKVGKSIPYELYMAVAEIINFVNRQKRAA
jgi:flagellar biosynthetic protein FlhB